MPSPASMVKLMKALGLKTDDLIRASDPQAVESINAKLSRKGGKPTEQDVFQEIARLNAAMPTQQGGLGMGVRNTAQERARGLGFDVEGYHATGNNFNAFIPNPYRGAVSIASSPEGAIRGANAGAADMTGAGSNIVMPLKFKSEGVQGLRLPVEQIRFLNDLPTMAAESEVDALMRKAPKGSYWFNYFNEVQKPNGSFAYIKKVEPKANFSEVQKTRKGAGGEPLPNWGDEKWVSDQIKKRGDYGWLQNDEAGVSASITDPSRIRSRFAAFDPARVNENNLLASRLLPFALPGLLALPTDEE